MAKPEAVEKLKVDYLRDAGYRTGFAGKWHAKMPKGWKQIILTISTDWSEPFHETRGWQFAS